jgi:hypothetical protein
LCTLGNFRNWLEHVGNAFGYHTFIFIYFVLYLLSYAFETFLVALLVFQSRVRVWKSLPVYECASNIKDCSFADPTCQTCTDHGLD